MRKNAKPPSAHESHPVPSLPRRMGGIVAAKGSISDAHTACYPACWLQEGLHSFSLKERRYRYPVCQAGAQSVSIFR